MTTSYVSSGAVAYSAASGASVTPAFPASISAGNMLIMIVGQRGSAANVGTVATPSGWTQVFGYTNTNSEDTGGYATTWAADTGNTNLYVFKKVATGSESGNETVTLASNNVSWASIHQYSKTEANWRINASMGKDVAGGNVSVQAFYPLGIANGNQLLGAMVIPTDAATFSAQAFVSSGATIGAATEVHEAASANGNQIGGFVARAACTAGSSGASVRPTLTATAGGTTTNVRGPGVLIRIADFANLTPTTLQGPDAFTAADGSALPANFTAGTADVGGGGATVQSNRARFLTGSAGGYTQQVSRRYTTQYEDAVYELTFRWPSLVELYPQFYVRVSGSGVDGDGGTFLELTRATNTFTIVQTGSYANARNLITPVALAYAALTDYHLIFGIVGNVLQYKIWEDGDPEPAYTTLDHSLGGGVGHVGIRGGPGNVGSVSIDIDDIALYNYFPAPSTTSVTSDSDIRWQVKNSVDSDSDIRWRVANVLTSDSDLRYAVRSFLNSDVDLRYAVRASVTSDSDLRWRVRAVLNSDSDIRWRVSVRLNSDSDIRWRVSVRLNSDSDIRWAVRSVLLSTVDLRWISRAQVQSDVDLRWLSKIQAHSNVDLRWAVRSILSSDVDLRWLSKAQAHSDVDLRWITDSSILSLSTDMDLRWAVRSVTLSTVDLRWITRNALASDLNLAYRVRSVALSDVDLRYAVRSVLAADLSALWRVRGLTLADLDLRWTVTGRVLSTVDLRWAVYTLSLPASGGVALSGTPTGPVALTGSDNGSSDPMVHSFDGTELGPIVIGG